MPQSVRHDKSEERLSAATSVEEEVTASYALAIFEQRE